MSDPLPSEADWRALVERVLKGGSFERLVGQTRDGIAVQPLYPADADAPRFMKAESAVAWRILGRIDHPDAAAANATALADLDQGADGLHIVLAGSTGNYGFGIEGAAARIDDLLARVDLAAGVPIEIDAPNHDFALALAALIARRGDAGALTAVDFGLDPLTAPKFADVLQGLAATGLPGRLCLADGRPVHAAGGSEAQELALAIASGVACLRALEAIGVAPAQGREKIGFRLAADADQFLTIAKFRALRRLWGQVEAACRLPPKPIHVHAETAWRMMTRRDPWINVLRATVAVFSAAVGGADAITVLPFTQALGLPDDAARRLARNTQLVLREEAHIGKVADPAGGSGGFEALTDALSRSTWDLFQKIERAGGLLRPEAMALLQSEVARVRLARQADIAYRRERLTGTSDFADPAEAPVAVLIQSPADIRAPAPFEPLRLAEPFERLRDRTDAQKTAKDFVPPLFLATLGQNADFSARAHFARTFFEAAGIRVIEPQAFDGLDALLAAFQTSGAAAACLCSTDPIYGTDAVKAARALRQAGAKSLSLAGHPKAHIEVLREAGVQHFVHVGCDAVATLNAIQDLIF